MSHEPRATIDFETRSECDIRRAGAWIYSKHPSTVIACLAWVLPGQDPNDVSFWHAGYGDVPSEQTGPTTLEDLFEYIRNGGIIEAHNSFFERCIWHHIATKPAGTKIDHEDGGAIIGATGMGAPPIKPEQWRCSAAKAAALAFPRSLGEACAAVGVDVQKDADGNRIMLQLAKPRPKRKADIPGRAYWIHDPDKHRHMHEYCKTDVRAEHALSEAIPDLSPFELRVWQADQNANWRGVKIDMDLVEAAIELDEKVKAKMNKAIQRITGIESGTKRKALLEWLQANGAELPDSSATTLDWFKEQPEYAALSDDVKKVLAIARDINRTSISKYHRIRDMVDPDDGRVRDLVRYHGAATGRWAGSGIQVQNFPRGSLPEGVSIDEAVEDVKTRDLEWCEAAYGDVLLLLSSVTRGALVSDTGKVLYVADYSAIEARIVLWLAEASKALDVFRRGDDIYCDMASGIFGRTITKKDKEERQLGKVTILGLGYGMGFLTFLLTLRTYDLHFTKEQVREIIGEKKLPRYREWVVNRLNPKPEHYVNKDGTLNVQKYKVAVQQAKKDIKRLRNALEDPNKVLHELALCKYLVDVYRDRYPEVPALWKAYEAASLAAVQNPGEPQVVGLVTWIVETEIIAGEERHFLRCYLPSGRYLTYADPFLKDVQTPWGFTRQELRYWGVHKRTKRWSRMSMYGGLQVENVDQATARDIMAWAFVLADEHEGYDPLATIHDELLAEADEGTGSVEDFVGSIMVNLPPCFDGCPIAAEGDVFTRYRK